MSAIDARIEALKQRAIEGRNEEDDEQGEFTHIFTLKLPFVRRA